MLFCYVNKYFDIYVDFIFKQLIILECNIADVEVFYMSWYIYESNFIFLYY
jgi:hypothetical protein